LGLLGILGLLLLISRHGHLENLIYKSLKSVAVSGLVLPLGVKNANAIQEPFKFAWPGLILHTMMGPFDRIDRTVLLSILLVALG
jgi:hypothetical protein